MTGFRIRGGIAKGLGWAALVPALILHLAGCGDKGTGGGPAAPKVTATDPDDGAVNVEWDASVQIEFDAAMDTATVNGAFSLRETGGASLAGAHSWNAASRLLTFAPAAPLRPGVEHTAALAATAKSAAGAALAAGHAFAFTTKAGGSPVVDATTPADGADGVALDVSVIISFTMPMDMASVAEALSFVDQNGDSLEYAVTWDLPEDGMEVTLDPVQPLVPNTQYTVTVSAEARSSSGVAMEEDYPFSFTTAGGGGPVVVQTAPGDQDTNVALDAVIEITFDRAMDTAATESALYVDDSTNSPVTGTFTWDSPGETMTFTPDSALVPESDYSVTIGTGARSAQGERMEGDYFFTFKTGTAKSVYRRTLSAASPRRRLR